MSEHRSIMEKLTRLRDQLPTGQLVTERAQELLDALNEHWFGKYLDKQQDVLQLVEDYANGQQFNEALLHKATKPLTAEEQQLETEHFWAIGGTARDVELQVELLNAKAMDLCSPAQKKQRQQQEIPPEAKQLPEKYQKDKRRWKTGWGIESQVIRGEGG